MRVGTENKKNLKYKNIYISREGGNSMITKKQIGLLSPYEVTELVKTWMKIHDTRLQICFAWESPREEYVNIPEEYAEEDFIITKSTQEKHL